MLTLERDADALTRSRITVMTRFRHAAPTVCDQEFRYGLPAGRTASPVRGPGAPRRRSAELSLTPPAPHDELTRIEAARRRARLLEGPGRGAEAAAAPPPPRGGRDLRDVAAAKRATISRCSSSGPRRAKPSTTSSRAALDELSSTRSRPARSRRCSAASTIARTRSSRSIPAPAAPSRRTGPRCCCACTCAGPSAAASSARSSTTSPATKPASRARR